MRAETEVGAGAEREVQVRIPLEVEPVRIGEHRGIAVRGTEPDHDLVARADLLVAERRGASRGAAEVLDGGDVPQQLLDRGGEVLRVLGQLNERYQRAISLRYLSGLTPEDAAHAMGLSKATFAVVLHRAMGALRKAIDQQTGEGS